MRPALFEAYPELANVVPYRPLGQLPTPLERVDGLLPGRAELWVKRDDLAGAAYGGNKVRKLEFLLADRRLAAPAWDRPRVLTFGGYGSHHVLALALYGQKLGLTVDAVVFPQPPLPHARDTLRCSVAAGARLFPSAGYLDLPLQLLRALMGRGRPLVIGPGGSSPLGTLGWLSGGLEIAAQVRAGEAPRFDAVYGAVGSGGMVAGLWIGLGDTAAEIVGVRAAPGLFANAGHCRRLGRRTAALIGRHLAAGHALPPRPPLRVDGRFLGPGYGSETAPVRDAVSRAAAVGMALDVTYTGRAMAALLADAATGRYDGKRVLFINSFNSRDLDWLRAKLPAPPAALPPRLENY